jgi:aspartate aminotransferase
MASPAQRILDLRAASKRPALAPAPAGAVSLAMGEPDFDTPQEVIDAAIEALKNGETHYADQQGLPALRDAIAESLPYFGDASPWSKDNIVVTQGATAALGALILSHVGPGDRVVIPHPAYSLYADLVVLAGGEVDYVSLASDLHFDFDVLEKALAGARMIIFSNPSNPNGIVHSKEELEKLGELVRGTDTIVVADEAYCALTYAGHAFTSSLEIASLADNIVYVQTFSKTYAMTGWRVGYVAGAPELVAAVAHFHRSFNGSLNSAAQFAALKALSLPDSAIEAMKQEYAKRREMVVEALNNVPGITLFQPEGAFYAFIRYNKDLPSTEVVKELTQAGVMTRAGSEYGPNGEGHVRISFAASTDDLAKGLDILKNYFSQD